MKSMDDAKAKLEDAKNKAEKMRDDVNNKYQKEKGRLEQKIKDIKD